MTNSRPLRVLATTIALWVALAGCGGGGVPPREWAADVCGSMQEAQKKTQKAASQFRPTRDDPAQTKDDFITLLTSVQRAVDTLQSDIESAGEPDTENGEKAKQQILDGLQASEDAFVKAREDVQSASASNLQELAQVFTRVGQDIAASQQKFGNLQDKLDAPELKQAFKQVKPCKELRA